MISLHRQGLLLEQRDPAVQRIEGENSAEAQDLNN